MRYYGVQNEVKSYLNRLQSEEGIEVSLSTVKTLNDRVEALKKSGIWSQYGLGFNDRDADSYFQRASVRDAIGRFEVCLFVRGMKTLGLWQNMVSWPMRSYQNAGTGSTVYSLGGLGVYDGSMINSSTWGTGGVRLSAFGSELSLGSATSLHSYGPFSYFSVQRYDALIGTSRTVLWMRQDASWPAATRTNVTTTQAQHRLNTSNTRRVLAVINVNTQPWHSQLTCTAGNETGFVTYNKSAPVVFGSATEDALAPTGQWRLRGDADITSAFQLIAHQNVHNIRESLYNLYRDTLGSNLGLP